MMLWSSLTDVPKTYECDLCVITLDETEIVVWGRAVGMFW